MNKNKFSHIIEYSTLILILSYLFVHNIFLVLTGIIISLYLINIDFINRLMRSINQTLETQKVYIESNKHNKEVKSNSTNLDSTQVDKNLTLVKGLKN